jgi:hypothetical protein
VTTIRAKPRPHIRYLPCFAQVASTPGDVAAILYQKGYADRAMSRLAAVSPDSEKEKWLRYVCAVEQSDWALAERFESAARRGLEQFEAARTVPVERLVVNGFSGASYRDHARIRLPGLETGNDGIQMLTPPLSMRLAAEEGQTYFTGRMTLPVRLAPGRYGLRGRLAPKTPFVQNLSWAMVLGHSSTAETTSVTLLAGKTCEFELNLMVDQEKTLALTFASEQAGGEVAVSDLELRWRSDDLLWPERRELYRALVRQAFHRGDNVAAMDWLKRARESIGDESGWLREEQRGHAGRMESKPGGVVFYPWLKLAGTEATETRAQVRLEALRDSPPPLKVRAYRKHWNGYKFFYDVKLPLQNLTKGANVVADIPMPKGVGLADIAIRIDPDVEWVSTSLRVREYPDGRVPLGH